MKLKDYLQVSGAVFILVAFVHATRLLMGWEVSINGQIIPLWVSVLGVVVAGFLGYTALKPQKK